MLFYHLLARRAKTPTSVASTTRSLPPLARPGLPRLARTVPRGFAQGYRLKDDRTSAKTGLRLRRVRLRPPAESFSVRPSFALPYMTGSTDEVEGPLFLRRFGVPFWAVARVFGKDPMYWYRLEVGLGRNSVVGTTVRQPTSPRTCWPTNTTRRAMARRTTSPPSWPRGCCLGAVWRTVRRGGLRSGLCGLQAGGPGRSPGYAAADGERDGWAATRLAWLALFPLVAVLRCFLHGWLNIRAGGKQATSCSLRCRRRCGRPTTPRPGRLRAADEEAVGVGGAECEGGVGPGAG